MAMFPPGQFAVIKASEPSHGDDRFILLSVDPDRAQQPGYMFHTSPDLTEADMRAYLGTVGLSATRADELIQRARDGWNRGDR